MNRWEEKERTTARAADTGRQEQGGAVETRRLLGPGQRSRHKLRQSDELTDLLLLQRHRRLAEGAALPPGDEEEGERRRYLQSLRLAALRELTPRQKEAVAYYYLKGLTMEEAARQMALHPSSVSRLLSRARGILQKTVWYYFFQ